MTTQTASQLAPELSSWCSDAGIDPNRALILHDVPADTDHADIEETAETVKAFGKVRVRDTKLDTKTGHSLVLCECRQDVHPDRIPRQLQTLDGGLAWKISLFVESESPADDFLAKLNKLMEEEGKTVKDVHAMLSKDVPHENSPESIIRAVGDLLEKTMRPTSENNAFRRLRTFSGHVPHQQVRRVLNTGSSRLA